MAVGGGGYPFAPWAMFHAQALLTSSREVVVGDKGDSVLGTRVNQALQVDERWAGATSVDLWGPRMTLQKKLKARVRARMAKTGERYAIAKMHVQAQLLDRLRELVEAESSRLQRNRNMPHTDDGTISQYSEVEKFTGYKASVLQKAVQVVDEAAKCVSLEVLTTYLLRPNMHSARESGLVQDWIDELLPKELFTLNNSHKKAYRLTDGKLLKFVGNRSSRFDPRLNPTAELCPLLAYDFSVKTPGAGVTRVWFALPKSLARAQTLERRGPGTNLARVAFEWVFGLPVVKAEKVALLNQRSEHG